MKIILASAILALTATSVNAADAIIEEPVAVVVPDTFSWTGGYIGINAGYSGGKFKNPYSQILRPFFPPFPGAEIPDMYDEGSFDTNVNGFSGGIQAGYNWQLNNGFVVGAEADFQGASLKGDTSGSISSGLEVGVETKVQWWGTVRGRVGYAATERFLVYGTGGLAYGKIKSNTLFLGEEHSSSKTKAGWTIGGGAEYAITNNWTLKSEYLYTDLGKHKVFEYNTPFNEFNLENKTKFHTVRVGLNYKF